MRPLASGGLPLGVAAGEGREARSERLEPGDSLVVVSDGVLDAVGRRPADLDRAWRVAAQAPSAAEAVAAVLEVTSGGEVDDDLTVLVLRRA